MLTAGVSQSERLDAGHAFAKGSRRDDGTASHSVSRFPIVVRPKL